MTRSFMNHHHVQTLLVIDDDPTIGEFVRRALPDWTVYVAYNGADGIAFVRAHPEQLHLVILDYRMPHDGVLVARQVREIDRTLRILPFSSVEEKSRAFDELGTAPLLHKRLGLSEEELRQAVETAAATPTRPLPRWAMLDDLQERACDSEAHILSRRGQTQSVVILASNRAAVQLLQLAVRGSPLTVVTSTTSPGTLELFLRVAPAQLILVDGAFLRAALALGAQFTIPVAVVTMSVVAAYTADPAAHVVLIDTDERELSGATEALARGERYRDSRLAIPPAAVGLTEREQQLLPLVLQGYNNEEIYIALARHAEAPLAEATIRRYRAQVFEKFAVSSLSELFERLATWFSFPQSPASP